VMIISGSVPAFRHSERRVMPWSAHPEASEPL
jgi:hypothetical protein